MVEAAGRSGVDGSAPFDLSAPESVVGLIERIRPRHTILAAAATNVAWCETNPRESRVINVDGTAATATACREVGSSLTFISTDYVFDGTNGPSGESEPTNPINEYGRQKLDAERAVLGESDRNLVIRTCQVFGADPRRMNFVFRVADGLRDGVEVQAPLDLQGTPTFAPDLAAAIAELTLTEEFGVWHVAGESFLSRYELAVAVAGAFGLDATGIKGIMADQMDDPVNRPRRAGLRNERLHAKGLDWMTPLDRALESVASMEVPR